jgi:hypothetical protein
MPNAECDSSLIDVDVRSLVDDQSYLSIKSANLSTMWVTSSLTFFLLVSNTSARLLDILGRAHYLCPAIVDAVQTAISTVSVLARPPQSQSLASLAMIQSLCPFCHFQPQEEHA